MVKRKVTKKLSRQQSQKQSYNLLDNLSEIKPKTANQQKVFDAYDEEQNLVIYGAAGTGKSFLSLYLSLDEALSEDSIYRKVIIIRSAVATRAIGHLPGTDAEKMSVYEVPYIGICNDLFNRGDAYEVLKQKGILEFESTSFMRGNTLKDCIIIFDEFQNCNFQELNTIVTRVGENCKIILCGDVVQNDLQREDTGFHRFMKIAERMESFSMIEFGVQDIVRSGFVKEYLTVKYHLENGNKI